MRLVLYHDAVYQVRLLQAASNPCPDTLLALAIHCEVMANLAMHECDWYAMLRYDREVKDWLDAYSKWGLQ